MFALRALGWLFALFGLFLLAVCGLAFFVFPEPPLPAKIMGGVGALLIASWLFLDWGSLRHLGNDQTVLRSTTASFAALLALGIAVTANVVVHRYDERWDLTETKRYTLAPQSVDVAKKLDREVSVVAFAAGNDPARRNLTDLLARYQEHTTLLKVEFYDPYGSPKEAEQYDIRSASPVVVMKVGENEQRLDATLDEEAITNALVRVNSDVQHSVCVVSGHEELELMDDQSPAGLGFAKQKLEGVNYKVSAISLLAGPPSPEACEVVVLAAPRIDLLSVERDRLAEYVAAGGGLIAMLDPMRTPDTAADLERYGVKVGDDLVIEQDPYRAMPQDASFLLLDSESFDIHPITSKLKGNALFGQGRSVSKGPEIPGLNVQVIATASSTSWAEAGWTEPQDTWAPTPGVDVVGDVPLAAAVEVTDPAAVRILTVSPLSSVEGAAAPVLAAPVDPAPTLAAKAGGKVVAYGDGDFATNQLITVGVNQDLLLNAIAWIVGEEDQISVRPNEAGKGKLTLDLLTLFVSGVTAILVAPGIAIIGAVGTWLRRRGL